MSALAACSGGESPASPASPTPAATAPDLAPRSPAVETSAGFVVHATPARRHHRAAPELRVELGRDARSPLRVVVSPGGAVVARRLQATASPGHLDGGAVVYPGAAPGMDARVFAAQVGVEDLLVARAPGAMLGYSLDLPSGWTLARSAVPGLVEVRDEHRAARLRLWARRAWDARGADVPLTIDVEGTRVRVGIDDGRVAAWPVVVDPEWTDASEMTIPRYGHTATLLPDGRVLVAGGDDPNLGLAELYDPRTATFTSTAPMSRARAHHTATLLRGGRVLMAGGDDTASPELMAYNPSATVEAYDPNSEAFAPVGVMSGPRSHHAAAALMDGRVLLAGGLDAAGMPRPDAEVFDPVAGAPVGQPLQLAAARADLGAALLPDGRVLLAGGHDATPETEVVDPSSGKDTTAGGSPLARWPATATLLPSGKVLIGGGERTSELFDPATNAITTAAGAAGSGATATLLPSGRVLYAGGTADYSLGPTLATALLYDPVGAVAFAADPMDLPRELATATLLPSGLVLVAGGWDRGVVAATASTELYDPGDATVESTGTMLATRTLHTSTLLPSGQVLIAGGQSTQATTVRPSLGALGAEVFDTTRDTFRAVGPLVQPRMRHAATLLSDGSVLLTGGEDPSTIGQLTATEVFVSGVDRCVPGLPMLHPRYSHVASTLQDGEVLLAGGETSDVELRSVAGAFSPAGMLPGPAVRLASAPLPDGSVLLAGGRDSSQGDMPVNLADRFDGAVVGLPPMIQARADHTATALPDGTVLVAGGSQGNQEATDPIASAERFDGTSFVDAGAMARPRALHTATLLAGGAQVLLAGGNADQSAELYDVAKGTSSLLGATMPEGVLGHAATLLGDGRVLITGGVKSDGISGSAIFYDPKSGTFTFPTTEARAQHTATLLPSGKVLVAGGSLGKVDSKLRFAVATASVFDPKTRAFTPVVAMAHPRLGHTATLAPDGRVLLAGGELDTEGSQTPSIEAWNGTTFSDAGQLATARAFHSATLLASGRILFAGGLGESGELASAEIYDPASSTSRPSAGSMAHGRMGHAAIRLPSGRVLVAGGRDAAANPVPGAEIYDEGADTFTAAAGSGVIPGDAHGVVLASGDVLIAGDLVTYLFDEASGELTVAGGAPTHTFGLTALAGGRTLTCGLDRCDAAGDGASAATPVVDGAQRDGHSLTRLADGEAFAVGVTPIGARHTFSYRSDAPGAVRPILASAPAQLVAGEVVTLKGERFATLSARGSDALTTPLPSVLPLVQFTPDGDVAPVLGETRSWSGDAITFVVPRTPYWGGGFLDVIVDGVPSNAVRVTLAPAVQGSGCGLDGECASGHCVDGVCCNEACASGCSTCRGGDGAKDGVCRSLPKGAPPRSGCDPTGDACSPTGRCDGFGECAFPPEGTTCDDPPGGACFKGACVGNCTSNLDCATGFVCTPEGRCAPVTTPGPDAPSCAAAPGTGRPPLLGWLAALAALASGVLRTRSPRSTWASRARTTRRRAPTR